MSEEAIYAKVIDEFKMINLNANEANQLDVEESSSDSDVVQTEAGVDQIQSGDDEIQFEHNPIKTDANKQSRSNCISQLFRSVWNRLFCCKKPADENSYSEIISGDDVEEQLPVDVSSHNEYVIIDRSPSKVVCQEQCLNRSGLMAGKQ